MVGLLAAEAKSANSPLREEELDMLSRECGLPEALEDQAKRIVGQILIRDFEAGYEDPKSFSSSLEWAGDPEYPNIARLTEDVVLEGRASGRFPLPPRLHGWGLVKDKLSLIGADF
ncbi:MAG TPA: hypothetical protein VFA90_14950 [Terriglobales bacterium]|nr:hypothetical protein [Terriglobales bacterium]